MLPYVLVSIKIIAVVFAALASSRIASRFFHRSKFSEKIEISTRTLFSSIARIIIFFLAMLITLDLFGISITPLLASLGIGSLAVALALQDTLNNFFSGFYLLIDKPLRQGDHVRIDGTIEGVVQRIGWRTTHVLNGSSHVFIIPNSKIAANIVVNYSLPTQEIGFSIPIKFDLSTPVEQAQKSLTKIAAEVQKKSDHAAPGFDTSISVVSLSNGCIEMSVSMRARDFASQANLRNDFLYAFHQLCQTERIPLYRTQVTTL